MDNIEETLSSILSDPKAMASVMELGKKLGLTGDTKNQNDNSHNSSHSNGENDLSAIASLLSSGDNSGSLLPSLSDQNTLGMLRKFLPLLSGLDKEDETTVLLQALRPFLSSSRQKRLDDAGKMLKVIRLLPVIQNTGLL